MGMDAKRLWMPFLATCSVFGWTTKFWTITGFSIKKPFQRFYVWTAAYAGFAGCKQLGYFKAGLQADKHSDGVWDHPQQEAVQHCNQNVHQQQVVHLWPHQTRRGGDLWKEQGEQAQHQGEPSALVTQGHSFGFFFHRDITIVSVTMNSFLRGIRGKCGPKFSPKKLQAEWTPLKFSGLRCLSISVQWRTPQCKAVVFILKTPKTVCTLKSTERPLAREKRTATSSQSAMHSWTSSEGSSIL